MRLIGQWLVNAATLLLLAWLAPQVGILPGFRIAGLGPALVAVLILGLLNITLRPILKLLSMPITCLTFGLFSLVINGVVFSVAANLVKGFTVGGFWNAFILAVLYSLLSSFFYNALFKE
jgi:putative membrane protein